MKQPNLQVIYRTHPAFNIINIIFYFKHFNFILLIFFSSFDKMLCVKTASLRCQCKKINKEGKIHVMSPAKDKFELRGFLKFFSFISVFVNFVMIF